MTFTEKARKSRALVLAGIVSLIAIYCIRHILSSEHVLMKCVISSIPLAIFIPGILARRYRSGSLLCFVLLIYFMVITQELFIPGKLWHDAAAMAVIVVLFVVSMFYARWQQRADIFEGEVNHGE